MPRTSPADPKQKGDAIVLATVQSATLSGVEGQRVDVEVHVQSGGLPTLTVVGLPDASVREARDRVRAAMVSSGLDWPQRRITINLAPGGLRKTGAGLDLAVAVGIIVASGSVEVDDVSTIGFLGELGLDGSIRPVAGALPMADAIDTDRLVVPPANLEEVALLGRERVYGVSDLAELIGCLTAERPWPDHSTSPPAPSPPQPLELADIRGQHTAKLALEIAAAGGHHLLLVGPPGAGKTMLAQRLVGLLPPLALHEALETTRIRSAAGELRSLSAWDLGPPYRAPHHGASAIALIGGGSSTMRPGEVSLAHNGVLFLDELGEFSASALDGLRQPLEERQVRVSRLHGKATYPADVLLVAAMNPCPCGESGAPGACRCSPAARARYHRRVSGPLLDRFDLRVGVTRPEASELFGGRSGECTDVVARRVAEARATAIERSGGPNVRLSGDALDAHAPLAPAAQRVLEEAVRQGRLSARGVGRIRSVARTIADLGGGGVELSADHICTAMALRVDPFGGWR